MQFSQSQTQRFWFQLLNLHIETKRITFIIFTVVVLRFFCLFVLMFERISGWICLCATTQWLKAYTVFAAVRGPVECYTSAGTSCSYKIGLQAEEVKV